MPHLSGVHLQAADPNVLARYYVAHLGMTAQSAGDTVRLGFGGKDAQIILTAGRNPTSSRQSDRYWKIGVTLPNVDIAYAQLRANGVDVSQPHQFQQIGYMCHFKDPAGYQIELLQHEFQDKRPDHAGNRLEPLGGGARIGQITLRTGNISASLAFYHSLGMRLLSIQPVPAHGFDLYFLAFGDETPPKTDLEAAENRPWLWQRPYTTLEFQHLPGTKIARFPGYGGLEISGLARPQDDDHGDPILPG